MINGDHDCIVFLPQVTGSLSAELEIGPIMVSHISGKLQGQLGPCIGDVMLFNHGCQFGPRVGDVTLL